MRCAPLGNAPPAPSSSPTLSGSPANNLPTMAIPALKSLARVIVRSSLSPVKLLWSIVYLLYPNNSLLLVDEMAYEESCGLPLSNVSLDGNPFSFAAKKNNNLYCGDSSFEISCKGD
ncbi:hypothetical protein MLD38_030132 [Melastoma candidum]|uniref:Uncharacterized protein n=1 Tax=Melastoma candidum TaxID=119954 RepID=A0ACB9MR05_9MYRT|nr:hypothetical protein MLD38_030132 [Melastoma candidum]